MSQEGLHVLQAEVRNFKNISVKVIEAEGRSFFITGPNASDKSSLIQAIKSPLSAREVPPESIKKGEDKGEIILKLGGTVNGEAKEYMIHMYFAPSTKKGRVVIKDKNGATIPNGKSTLKTLFNSISFDPMEFVRSSPKDTVEMLKRISGVDFSDINKILFENEAEARSLKSQIKDLDAEVEGMPYTPEERKTYANKLDDTEARKAISNIGESIAKHQEVKSKTEAHATAAELAEDKAADISDKIKYLEKEIENLRVDKKEALDTKAHRKDLYEKGTQWLTQHKEPSIAEAQSELDRINNHNRAYEEIDRYRDKYRLSAKKKKELEIAQETIKTKKEEKLQLVKDANLPVDGLTFDDDGVYYDGLPFHGNQINRAKQIEIGVEMAMALNPELKVVFLEDASLLDNKNLHHILQATSERGYQLIAEIVDHSSNDSESHIDFIEEEA